MEPRQATAQDFFPAVQANDNEILPIADNCADDPA
jgi:hypothetical protein